MSKVDSSLVVTPFNIFYTLTLKYILNEKNLLQPKKIRKGWESLLLNILHTKKLPLTENNGEIEAKSKL